MRFENPQISELAVSEMRQSRQDMVRSLPKRQESAKIRPYKKAQADYLMCFAHQYQPPAFLDGLMSQLFTISCPTPL